jgi:peroxiredoxin
MSLAGNHLAIPLLLGAVLCGLSGATFAGDQVPEFQLKDPSGGVHTQKDLQERGAVIVISIPNVKHSENQSRWTNGIKKGVPETGAQVVVIEDLSQSNVREKAVKGMRENFKPGQRTLLLVDETGEVRRAFGVPQDETTILVVDRQGGVAHRVSGISEPDEVHVALKAVVKAALALGDGAAKKDGK